MSIIYSAVVDVHATREEARSLADSVLRVLVKESIVKDLLDPAAVLGGEGGYRPGDRIPELYTYTGKASAQFWNSEPCGVEVMAGPWINASAMPILQELACPHCAKNFAPDLPPGFGDALGAFLEGDPKPTVICSNCEERTPAATWRAFPHLGFSYLTFLFWNWPLLWGENWRLSIPALIERTLGHSVILALGKV